MSSETDNIKGNIFTNPKLIGLTFNDIYYHPYCDLYDCEFSVAWDSKFSLIEGSSTVQGATFEITDSEMVNVFSGLTDNSGSVFVPITEFVENSGTRDIKNPYAINISYFGWNLFDNFFVNSGQTEFFYSMNELPGCIVNFDCDDNDICTYDICVGGNCVNPVMPGISCNDNVDCTAHDLCSIDGSCLGMVPSDDLCIDRPECNIRTCTQSGCVYSECVTSDIFYQGGASLSPDFIYNYLTFYDLFRITY